MNRKSSLSLTMAVMLLSFAPSAQAAINFTKAEALATSIGTSLGGVLATAFFTIAIIIAGFLAAFNRISWMWVGLIVVGGFLVFGGPTLVADLRASLG